MRSSARPPPPGPPGGRSSGPSCSRATAPPARAPYTLLTSFVGISRYGFNDVGRAATLRLLPLPAEREHGGHHDEEHRNVENPEGRRRRTCRHDARADGVLAAGTGAVLMARGRMPSRKANEVIKMGRKRIRDASMVASMRSPPLSCSFLGEFNNQNGVLRRQTNGGEPGPPGSTRRWKASACSPRRARRAHRGEPRG